MESEVLLLALIKRVEEALEKVDVAASSRSLRGRQGPPGKDFDIEEHRESLRAWAKEFSIKFEDFTAEQVKSLRGEKGEDGRDGRDGRDGKNFSFEENKEYFETLAKSFALKFEDFTEEQIKSLRGDTGKPGRDGRDGKDFSLEENKEYLETLAKNSAIKFEDFSSEQIEKLRGPEGSPGKNFSLEEYEDEVKGICREIIDSSIDTLKLHFSDLTAEDIEKIRGPRGRDGRDGKNFVFEEHEEFFNGLKLKFSDLSKEEVDKLKLNFSDLTEEEKDSLKLKYDSLTEDQKIAIRGPRGQRGRQGDEGPQGIPGPRGEIGPRGIPGISGRNGISGLDGVDGADAPVITDIKTDQVKDEVEFIFEFSDGSEIRTDPIKLPRPDSFVAVGSVSMPGSSSGSGVETYANFASLPTGQPDGSVAVTLDSHELYIYNSGTSTWTLSSGSGGSSGLDLVSYTQYGGF